MIRFSLKDEHTNNIVVIRGVLPMRDESFFISTGVIERNTYVTCMRNDGSHRFESYSRLIASELMVERSYKTYGTGAHVVEHLDLTTRGEFATIDSPRFAQFSWIQCRSGFVVLPAIQAKYLARLNFEENLTEFDRQVFMAPSMAEEILGLVGEPRGFILINLQENRIIHVVPPGIDEYQSMSGETFGTFSWNAQTVCLAMNDQVAIMDNPF